MTLTPAVCPRCGLMNYFKDDRQEKICYNCGQMVTRPQAREKKLTIA